MQRLVLQRDGVDVHARCFICGEVALYVAGARAGTRRSAPSSSATRTVPGEKIWQLARSILDVGEGRRDLRSRTRTGPIQGHLRLLRGPLGERPLASPVARLPRRVLRPYLMHHQPRDVERRSWDALRTRSTPPLCQDDLYVERIMPTRLTWCQHVACVFAMNLRCAAQPGAGGLPAPRGRRQDRTPNRCQS